MLWPLFPVNSRLPQITSTPYPENNFCDFRLNAFLPILDTETHCKPLEIENLDIFLAYCEETGSKSAKNAPGGPFQAWTESQIDCFAMSHIHSVSRGIPSEGSSFQQISKTSKSASSFHHQAAAPNQLPVSTTRQQHQISFQFLPPDSSTKSASASTIRQQHQISFQLPPPGSSTKSASASSFHHQAAAPNQLPVSATRQQHHISQPPARHPANQLLTILPCHTHIMAARSVVV